MNATEYCSTICKAKCCHFWSLTGPVKCPNLNDNNLCSIYKKRFTKDSPDLVIIGEIRNKPLTCGKIEYLLAKNQIPEAIKKQCCFYDKKLLEK